MFVGRSRELEQLEKAYRCRKSVFLPVYGRRRVGKTELLLQFTQGKPGLFYLGQKAPCSVQIRQFLKQGAEAAGEPLLAELNVTTWRDALTKVMERVPRDKKFVLVLDEFQWMAQTSPELPSVLQELWDMDWSRRGNVMLMLCGSFIGFMEREVLGKESPLFGRKTGQIFLRPFGFREAGLFHKELSLVDRAKIYYVCGGIPYYLKLISAGKSLAANLQTHLLDPGGALSNEPDFLLREELREVEKFYALLMVIATGAGVASEIERLTGVPARSQNYYLSKMEALGYVSRRYPLTRGRPNPRQVRYVLEDPLLRFWFRFLYLRGSELLRRSPAENYRSLLKPELESYFGSCFERLCREALPDLYLAEGEEPIGEVGEYWSKETQIDVVCLREDEAIDLGECKWGRSRSLPQLEAELREKMRFYPNPRNGTVRGLLFTRSAAPKSYAPSPDVKGYCLEDLYGG